MDWSNEDHELIEQSIWIWRELLTHLCLGDLSRLQMTCRRLQDRIQHLQLMSLKQKELPIRKIHRSSITTLTEYILWLYQAQDHQLPLWLREMIRSFQTVEELCEWLQFDCPYRIKYRLCLVWKLAQLRNSQLKLDSQYHTQHPLQYSPRRLIQNFTLKKYVHQSWQPNDRFALTLTDFESQDPDHLWLHGIKTEGDLFEPNPPQNDYLKNYYFRHRNLGY